MSDTEGRLRDFLAWVEIRRPISSTASVDSETLEVVAQGIKNYLAGKKPWTKPRGNKPNPDLMWRCYWRVRYSESEPRDFMPQHKGPGGAYTVVGDELNLSADAVESHVRNAEKKRKEPGGTAEFLQWVSKEKRAAVVRLQPASTVSSQNDDK